MADNITLPGTGQTIATKENAGVDAQKIILVSPADFTKLIEVIDLSGAGTGPYGLGVVHLAKQDVRGTVGVGVAAADAPVQLGGYAVAHGSNPAAVDAGDVQYLLCDRAGIPFVKPGHPNTISRVVTVLDSDGAQTNASLVGTIATGAKIVLTYLAVRAGILSSPIAVRIGFGLTTIPAAALAGVNGVVLDVPSFASGQSIEKGSGSGIVAIGADGEELRLTCGDPATGGITIEMAYHTIEA